MTITPSLRGELELRENGTNVVPLRPVPTHSWTPIDLVALGQAPPEPPTLGGIVYPGRRHIWSGEPEALKTWLALCVAAEEIRAENSTFYIDFENGARDILARLRNLGLEDAQISGHFVYMNPHESIKSASADVQKLLVQRRPSLVFIDAFASACELHSLDDNSTRDVETFYRTVVDPLRAHGAGVVILDHLAKNTETRGRWAIGSQRKVGAADVHLGLEILQPFGRGRTGRAKIITHKDRPGYLPRPRAAEFEIVSDADTERITWDIRLAEQDQQQAATAKFRPTCLMERVSRYLELVNQPASRTTIRQDVTGNERSILVAVDRLVEEGFAEPAEGPRTGRYYASIRPYREAEDDPPVPDVPKRASDVPGTNVPSVPPLTKGHATRHGTDAATVPSPDDDIPF